MKLTVLKLGTVCRDRATELEGTLTHWVVDMGKNVRYLFQPKGLDDAGQPVKKLVLEKERLNVDDGALETVDVPFEILGTVISDKASGFTGMAVEFIRHINGCFHAAVQPAGVLPVTGKPIQRYDFDLRECTGEKISEMTEAELAKSKRAHPSPTGDTFDREPPIVVSGTESHQSAKDIFRAGLEHAGNRSLAEARENRRRS